MQVQPECLEKLKPVSRPVSRNVVWGSLEWRRGGGAEGAWGLGRNIPLPSGDKVWGGGTAPPKKNFSMFSFEMVHFDAFWSTY